MKNKKIAIKPRLPMEVVLALRTQGGPQCSEKGKRGYDRKRVKHKIQESLKKVDYRSFPSQFVNN